MNNRGNGSNKVLYLICPVEWVYGSHLIFYVHYNSAAMVQPSTHRQSPLPNHINSTNHSLLHCTLCLSSHFNIPIYASLLQTFSVELPLTNNMVTISISHAQHPHSLTHPQLTYVAPVSIALSSMCSFHMYDQRIWEAASITAKDEDNWLLRSCCLASFHFTFAIDMGDGDDGNELTRNGGLSEWNYDIRPLRFSCPWQIRIKFLLDIMVVNPAHPHYLIRSS